MKRLLFVKVRLYVCEQDNAERCGRTWIQFLVSQ